MLQSDSQESGNEEHLIFYIYYNKYSFQLGRLKCLTTIT